MTDVAEKVLYVADDEASFRKPLCIQSQKAGWKVREASNGEELATLLKKHQEPAVVLIDVCMPEKDGICVIDDIKDLDGKYILHFMTGHGAEHSIAARLSAEARGIRVGATFHKPFRTAKMIECIESDATQLYCDENDGSVSQTHNPNAASPCATSFSE